MNVTVEECYEQTKRVLRRMCEDAGIADEKGRWFILSCSDCGQPFPTESEMGMVGQHAELAHDWDGETNLSVDLIWIGEGLPPEPRA